VLNPNGYWLLRFLPDATIRFVFLYGGSSSAKSYSVAQVFLMLTLFEGENHLVLRKVGASIEKTIYADFRAAIECIPVLRRCFRVMQHRIVCNINGARIDFSGLDDPEKIKGISQYKRVFLDELSEYDESDFKQIRKRLRGKEGQQIVAAWNPISEEHWVKKRLLDLETWHEVPMTLHIGVDIPPEYCRVKSVKLNEAKPVLNARSGEYETHPPDMALIQSTYLNNFWVVGSPDGTFGYYDAQCVADFERDRVHDPDYYQVYALGEWGHIRTGAEFFPSFSRAAVCGDFPYDPSLSVHVSMDSNVLPYVTATFWQKVYKPDDAQQVTQIGELPIESPDNSARRAAKVVAAKLREMGYTGRVYLHGDASGKAANTIDEQNRSFFDLVIDQLEKDGYEVEDLIGGKNPSVSMTGEFINAVWEGRVPGVSIRVDSGCTVSISDYQAVQKDENGNILKAKVTNPVSKQKYEPHGHITDCLRYVCHDLLLKQYTDFSMSRKRSLYSESEMRFFNPSGEYGYGRTLAYLMPNVEGRFVMAVVSSLGDSWHLVDAVVREVRGSDEITEAVTGVKADAYIVECQQSYFPMVRGLRSSLGNVSAMKMSADVKTRIKATADWIRERVCINPSLVGGDTEYSRFVSAMLDYSDTMPSDVGPSAVMSGIAKYVIRSGL